MRLKNNNVEIRDFAESDIEKKIEWINNPNNNRFLHYDIPLSYDKTLAWFNNKDNSTRLDCVIEYDGVPVGLIGLLNLKDPHNKAEFYISIGETDFKHKGIAYAATKLMLSYAFGVLGKNKIYLNVDAENVVACRLYEKVGFQCEGYFKKEIIHRGQYVDRKRYAILQEEFEKEIDEI